MISKVEQRLLNVKTRCRLVFEEEDRDLFAKHGVRHGRLYLSLAYACKRKHYAPPAS